MKQVKMYTTRTCPHCLRAKILLENLGVTPEIVDITDSDSLREEMVNVSRRKTVPQIFIDGALVGGADDLTTLHSQGHLIPVLQGEMSLLPK